MIFTGTGLSIPFDSLVIEFQNMENSVMKTLMIRDKDCR